jgi:acylphosphatase
MAGAEDIRGRRSVQVRIEGNVQGVGFRNWTQRLAGQLGLTGWVRNRRDGSVEAVFSGTTKTVEEALKRCRMGPRSAKVTEVTVIGEGAGVVEGFDIRPGV